MLYRELRSACLLLQRTQPLGVLIRLGRAHGVGMNCWEGRWRGEVQGSPLTSRDYRLILRRVWSYPFCLNLPSKPTVLIKQENV